MKENDALVLGGLLIGGFVLYLVISGSQSNSSGVVFGQADPASVQALYAANAADTQANDQSKSSIATSYLSYLGLINTNAAATQQAGIGASAAESIASTQASSALAIANSNNAATVQTAQIAGTAEGVVAGDQATAATAGYNAAARAQTATANAQASASRTASNDSLWGSLVGAVTGILPFLGSSLGSFGTPAPATSGASSGAVWA